MKVNHPTVIGDILYNQYYSDEFFEHNDLILVQVNMVKNSFSVYNIDDNIINIREYIPQTQIFNQEMVSGLRYFPVAKGTNIEQLQYIRYTYISNNLYEPWLTIDPPISFSRLLISTEISDDLTYVR